MADQEKAAAAHAELQSGKPHDGDVALDLFANGEELADVIDPVEEKKLVRKIDWMVIPFICITYLVTYIDKATIGYAAVFGLSDDLGLTGNQFSWLGKSPSQDTSAKQDPDSGYLCRKHLLLWLPCLRVC